MTSALPTEPASTPPPFVIHSTTGEPGPMVFASPHSGGWLPPDMGARSDLSRMTLRSAEDVGVDQLVGGAPRIGIPLIAAVISRTYLDLNRAPEELDPALIEGVTASASARVAAGYGVVPRRAGDGSDLYDRRLSADEAAGRIARVHTPYHAGLAGLMQAAHARHGMALLLDWHSMPSRATRSPSGTRGGRAVDIVLGDRHGASARGGVTRRIRTLFEAEGLRVALNSPYAGGYATEAWSRPDEGFQAVQVEISRALYLDEDTLEPSSDWSLFTRRLSRVITALARETWPR